MRNAQGDFIFKKKQRKKVVVIKKQYIDKNGVLIDNEKKE